jgi:hypothetical protein
MEKTEVTKVLIHELEHMRPNRKVYRQFNGAGFFFAADKSDLLKSIKADIAKSAAPKAGN